MGVSKELFELGFKKLSKSAINFFDNVVPKTDHAGIIRAATAHSEDLTKVVTHAENYLKNGDQRGLMPMMQKFDEWNREGLEAVKQADVLEQGTAKDINSLYPQYTRPDAIKNLQEAGADRLSNMKRTPRTIQGPVPPQLADKTFDQGARSYEEAVMLGTTKYVDEDGVAQQIRNYGSPTAPHGRVTKVDVRKMSGRGTEGRIAWEKILTIDENAKGFYGVKLKGHEHAHHWNPIGVMKRIVEGLDPKLRDQLIAEAQDEFGLYSGNVMFNLRQLPTKVHDKLHKALNKAGYDPKKMQSFVEADYATRKAFLKEFSKVLNDLDQQVFGEIMIEKHGPDWISKFKGLQD